MWTVQSPTFSASETFEICISRIRDSALRVRLTSIAPIIAVAADDYEVRGEARTLNLIAASGSVGGIVTRDEMVDVYDQRMAGKAGPGRWIYDQIKLLPKGDRCPFCDQRNVSTLDHFLPKTHYPALAVTPMNLVGMCMECNKLKLSLAPTAAEELIMHPYFDDVSPDQWLVAQVVQQNPCGIVFSVVRPASWDDVTFARVSAHFALFGLDNLYSSEGARELANIRHNLQMHFDAGGLTAVQTELRHQWQSRRANQLNSWQTAMYEAIAHDNWFCAGGFS